MLTSKVYRLSIHSLISICTLYHTMVCEQKSYNPNYTKFWVFWQKWLTVLSADKAFMIFWKMYSASETIVWCKTINLKTTIFQCSKNYGVARLKVAPTMTDVISLKENRLLPCKNFHILWSYLKIISTFLTVDIHLIVNCLRSSKMISKLSRPSSFWVFDQNNILIVLIHNLKIA